MISNKIHTRTGKSTSVHKDHLQTLHTYFRGTRESLHIVKCYPCGTRVLVLGCSSKLIRPHHNFVANVVGAFWENMKKIEILQILKRPLLLNSVYPSQKNLVSICWVTLLPSDSPYLRSVVSAHGFG